MTFIGRLLGPGVRLQQALGLRARLVLVSLALGAPLLLLGLLQVARDFGQAGGAGWTAVLWLLGLLLMLYAVLAFYQSVIGSVDALSQIARNSARGNLSQKVAVPGGDELAEAGRDLEAMSENFSGLVGTILTMTMVMLTSLAMTRERERGTMENLLATPARPFEVMVGKILPYVLIGYVQVLIVFAAARWLFEVPMEGSHVLLTAAVLLSQPDIGQTALLGMCLAPLLILSGVALRYVLGGGVLAVVEDGERDRQDDRHVTHRIGHAHLAVLVAGARHQRPQQLGATGGAAIGHDAHHVVGARDGVFRVDRHGFDAQLACRPGIAVLISDEEDRWIAVGVDRPIDAQGACQKSGSRRGCGGVFCCAPRIY